MKIFVGNEEQKQELLALSRSLIGIIGATDTVQKLSELYSFPERIVVVHAKGKCLVAVDEAAARQRKGIWTETNDDLDEYMHYLTRQEKQELLDFSYLLERDPAPLKDN